MQRQLNEKLDSRLELADRAFREMYSRPLSASKKNMLRSVLENTSRCWNEALQTSTGVNSTQLGRFKKTVLDITNIVYPNLINFAVTC